VRPRRGRRARRGVAGRTLGRVTAQREQPGLHGGQPLGQLTDLGGEPGEVGQLIVR